MNTRILKMKIIVSFHLKMKPCVLFQEQEQNTFYINSFWELLSYSLKCVCILGLNKFYIQNTKFLHTQENRSSFNQPLSS